MNRNDTRIHQHVLAYNPDSSYREKLVEYIYRYFFENPGEDSTFECTAFPDGADCLATSPTDYDIAFLDVVMPQVNGIECARRMRDAGSGAIVVFVTETAQYALMGYGVDALDYLLKPLYYSSFATVMGRALGALAKAAPTMLRIDYDKTVNYVDVSTIYYVETSGKKTLVHARSGDYSCSDTMRDLEEKLVPLGFGRCHQAIIVNIAHIESVRKNELLVHGEWVPMSRNRREEFMNLMLKVVGATV